MSEKWTYKYETDSFLKKKMGQQCDATKAGQREGDDGIACLCLPREMKHRTCSCCRVPQTITDNHIHTHTKKLLSPNLSPHSTHLLCPSITCLKLLASCYLVLPLSPSPHPPTHRTATLCGCCRDGKTICSWIKLISGYPSKLTPTQ